MYSITIHIRRGCDDIDTVATFSDDIDDLVRRLNAYTEEKWLPNGIAYPAEGLVYPQREEGDPPAVIHFNGLSFSLMEDDDD